MDGSYSDILVIGAGMAGLACATALAETGLDVRVIDKGRGPGGRMAARRVEIAGEEVSFDHGAQYFTARDPGFQRVVAQWEVQRVVARWGAAGSEAWVGVPGMNGPIRAMAQPINVHWGVRAAAVLRTDAGWSVDTGEERLVARTVLIAVPAEQAKDLLANADCDLAAIPAGVNSQPCWAVMAAFSAPLDIEDDAIRDADAAISWAARNSAKPERDGCETWVVHASPGRSRELLDLPKQDVARQLLADFFAQTGADPAEPTHLDAHRWLYAMPASIKGDAAHFDAASGLGIAGDYLHSPRVEGAWLSGRALAEKVVRLRQS